MSLWNAARTILVMLPLMAANAEETPPGASIDQLAWLAGCWASDGSDAGSEEYWMRPAGGTMLGMNRTVHHGRTVAFEFLRIFENKEKSLTLLASPSQQSSTFFQLLSISPNEVVFENPQHDFPQRILYRLVEAGQLLGQIDGVSSGERRTIDFPMTRTACDD